MYFASFELGSAHQISYVFHDKSSPNHPSIALSRFVYFALDLASLPDLCKSNSINPVSTLRQRSDFNHNPPFYHPFRTFQIRDQKSHYQATCASGSCTLPGTERIIAQKQKQENSGKVQCTEVIYATLSAKHGGGAKCHSTQPIGLTGLSIYTDFKRSVTVQGRTQTRRRGVHRLCFCALYFCSGKPVGGRELA